MICPACQKDIDVYPCACGYQPNAATVKHTWLIQTCTEPGCTVVIRSLPGEQEAVPRCKWHKTGHAYNSDQIQSFPSEGPAVSLDEFGIDLFQAIKTQSAIRQAEKTVEIYRKKGLKRQVRDYEEQVKTLNGQLSSILNKNTIAPADLQRLLAIT